MENNTFFNRLKRLFSTNTIVRRIGKDKLRVVDISKSQAKEKLNTNRLIDRFSKLHSTMGVINPANDPNFHTLKLQLYGDYEVMDEDSIISSALDIYADESTLRDEFGEVLTINCKNDEIKKLEFSKDSQIVYLNNQICELSLMLEKKSDIICD